jgi:hypothetical protein
MKSVNKVIYFSLFFLVLSSFQLGATTRTLSRTPRSAISAPSPRESDAVFRGQDLLPQTATLDDRLCTFFDKYLFETVSNEGYSEKGLIDALLALKQRFSISENLSTIIDCLNDIVSRHPKEHTVAWEIFSATWAPISSNVSPRRISRTPSKTPAQLTGEITRSSSSGGPSTALGSVSEEPAMLSSASRPSSAVTGLVVETFGGYGGFMPISTNSSPAHTVTDAVVPFEKELTLPDIAQEMRLFFHKESFHNSVIDSFLDEALKKLAVKCGVTTQAFAAELNRIMNNDESSRIKRRWNRYLLAKQEAFSEIEKNVFDHLHESAEISDDAERKKVANRVVAILNNQHPYALFGKKDELLETVNSFMTEFDGAFGSYYEPGELEQVKTACAQFFEGGVAAASAVGAGCRAGAACASGGASARAGD